MKRIESIDLLKAILLILMTVDHLQLFAFESLNFIYAYSYQPLGFIAATEGFIFLSGLMMGIVYGKKLLRDKSQFRKQLKGRIKTLYRYHVLSFAVICSLFLLPVFNNHWDLAWQGKLALWHEDPLRAFFMGITLLYQSSFVDILPLYMGLLVLALVAMPFMGGRTSKVVLGVSVFLWGIGQFFPQEALGERLGVLLGWYEFLSWQLLFVVGIFIGFRYVKGVRVPLRRDLLLLGAFLSVIFFGLRHFAGSEMSNLGYNLLEVRTLGLLRIINFAAFTYVLYYLFSAGKLNLKFPILSVLGSSSLQVYTFHVVVVYALGPFKNWINGLGLAAQMGLFLLALTTLYVPILWQMRGVVLGNIHKTFNKAFIH